MTTKKQQRRSALAKLPYLTERQKRIRERLMPQKHWYRTNTMSCVVCGYFEEWKTRVYGIKPENPADRRNDLVGICTEHVEE